MARNRSLHDVSCGSHCKRFYRKRTFWKQFSVAYPLCHFGDINLTQIFIFTRLGNFLTCCHVPLRYNVYRNCCGCKTLYTFLGHAHVSFRCQFLDGVSSAWRRPALRSLHGTDQYIMRASRSGVPLFTRARSHCVCRGVPMSPTVWSATARQSRISSPPHAQSSSPRPTYSMPERQWPGQDFPPFR